MTRFIRSLRGDLRLAARPACLLVLVGVALLAGLSSAVMQDASFEQLDTAREAVRDRVWTATPCTGPAGCRRARQQERRAAEGFLFEQQRTAARVGTLQVPSGVLRFAAAFMGLGTGVVGIALLATFTLAGEWTRNTIGLALAGGVTARGLAMRRFIALCLLGLVAFAAAAIGAALAAAWGQSARPLSAGGSANVGKPSAGGLVLLMTYSVIATAFAWVFREPMRTLLFTVGAVGVVAVTTPFGAYSPGAMVASALDIDRLLELEIGYLWVWPELTFARSTVASPAHVIPGPSWGVAVAVLTLVATIAGISFGRGADRSDPLAV